MVNPDADGRGWTGDAAEEPGRRGQRHPPARLDVRAGDQLTRGAPSPQFAAVTSMATM